MYLQTPKRPNLPPTPSYTHTNNHSKTSLPPLSSLLAKEINHPSSMNSSNQQRPRLPSIDSFNTPSTSKIFNYNVPLSTSSPNASLLNTSSSSSISNTTKYANASTPSKLSISNISIDTSDGDISIDDSMIKPSTKRKLNNSNLTSPNDSKSFAFISHSVATYPSNEPSIDNAPLARRKRRRTSPNELSILNNEFKLGSTPNKLRRVEIAKKVCMNEKAVQIWFQNKRQSLRKHYNNEKEICELPPTPDSSILINGNLLPHNNQLPPPPPPQSQQSNPYNQILPPLQSHLPPSSLVSSTPTKPMIHRFQSQPCLQSPPSSSNDSSTATSMLPHPASPVKFRSSSASNIHDFQFKPILTPITSRHSVSTNISTPKSISTPPTSIQSAPSNIHDKVNNPSNDPIDTTNINTGLVLNETKKKQPNFLNSNRSSTMTFKLAPPKIASSSSNNLLNRIKGEGERKPLGQLDPNVSHTSNIGKSTVMKAVAKTEDSCIENLLSLRAGQWK